MSEVFILVEHLLVSGRPTDSTLPSVIGVFTTKERLDVGVKLAEQHIKEVLQPHCPFKYKLEVLSVEQDPYLVEDSKKVMVGGAKWRLGEE